MHLDIVNNTRRGRHVHALYASDSSDAGDAASATSETKRATASGIELLSRSERSCDRLVLPGIDLPSELGGRSAANSQDGYSTEEFITNLSDKIIAESKADPGRESVRTSPADA